MKLRHVHLELEIEERRMDLKEREVSFEKRKS
jgi:hypothetical protein